MAAGSRVLLDLSSPAFLDVFLRLDTADLAQAAAALDRIRKPDWAALYRHPGYQWEAVAHIPTPTGAKAHSLRLSRTMRAIGYRDGDHLRLVSLHPDHDSAYQR